MLRKLALLLIPIALLAAACSSGGGDSKQPAEPDASVLDSNGDGIYDSSDSADVLTDPDPADTTDDTSPLDDTSGDEPADVASDPDDGGDTGLGNLFSTLNPFELLDAASAGQPAADVDSALNAALLTAGDLPGSFTDLGNFTYNLPTEEGDVSMAMRMFASGDVASGEMGSTVMSAVMQVPPGAAEEFAGLGNQQLTEGDLEGILGEAEAMGVGLTDVSILDTNGLGEAAFGMHLVIDFSGLFGAFGAGEIESPFPSGMAMDMYAFVRDDHVLMVMVMWPADGSSGVDGRDLAGLMDSRSEF